jgi:hypothetical protein
VTPRQITPNQTATIRRGHRCCDPPRNPKAPGQQPRSHHSTLTERHTTSPREGGCNSLEPISVSYTELGNRPRPVLAPECGQGGVVVRDLLA